MERAITCCRSVLALSRYAKYCPPRYNGFSWKQTYPSGSGVANCGALGTNLAPAGHTVPVATTSVSDINFGNVRGVTLNCGQTVQFPSATGEPDATVVVPTTGNGCTSNNLFVVFDVGVNADEGFTQFVVFGGDPNGTAVFSQNIAWEPETGRL